MTPPGGPCCAHPARVFQLVLDLRVELVLRPLPAFGSRRLWPGRTLRRLPGQPPETSVRPFRRQHQAPGFRGQRQPCRASDQCWDGDIRAFGCAALPPCRCLGRGVGPTLATSSMLTLSPLRQQIVKQRVCGGQFMCRVSPCRIRDEAWPAHAARPTRRDLLRGAFVWAVQLRRLAATAPVSSVAHEAPSKLPEPDALRRLLDGPEPIAGEDRRLPGRGRSPARGRGRPQFSLSGVAVLH